MKYAYFKKKIIPIEDANINIQTNSLHYGTCIFEGIRAYYQANENSLYVLFLEEHYRRFIKNSKVLFMNIEESLEELENITIQLLKANQPSTDVYIRPFAYFSDLAISPKLIGYQTEVAIYIIPMNNYIDVDSGIKAKVSSWTRIRENILPPSIKVSGAYVNSALAKTEALLDGYDEAIMLNEHGNVCEASAQNIFIVKNNILITPPNTEDILEGITRKAILKIAEHLNLKSEERPISRIELYQADEVFLCGTASQISPVIEIDKHVINNGKPGPITQKIQRIYFQSVRGQYLTFQNWVKKVQM